MWLWRCEVRDITKDAEHAVALAEIERLWDAEPGTLEGDQLNILITLVEGYERKRWGKDFDDAIEALKCPS
jgi:HTH-type transcriptional regulator/antitoxin HigA